LAGSTTEAAGFAKEVTEAGMSMIQAYACEITPALSTLVPVTSWAGLRPRSPDELPILGNTAETEGLFFATGHYRNGILLAPLTAELIAGLIVDNAVTQELQTFTPDRFQTVGVN
jgi:glycine oxidase